MKTVRFRPLSTLILICFLLLAACSPLLDACFSRRLPPQEGTFNVTGLQKTVTIARDDLGVPYIRAASMEDLAFAAGYVHASDRIGQMIGYKLMAQGRISEMIGPAGLNIDIFMRSLNLRQASDRLYDSASPEARSIFQYYSRGVNAWLESHPGCLPPEMVLSGHQPEKWQPKDCTSLFALLNLGLAFNLHEEINALNLLRRVGPEKTAWLLPVYPDEDPAFDEARKLLGIDLNATTASLEKLSESQFEVLEHTCLGVAASNNWAVSPDRTASQAAILANDTHLPVSLPSMWYLMHLECPQYNAAGISVPGLPAIVAGYNGQIAWGMTMVMGDNQDLFLEKLLFRDERLHYLYKNQWLPVTERSETFKIKGRRAVTRTIHETIHGPVLNDVLAESRKHYLRPLETQLSLGIALQWSAFEPDSTIDAFFNLGRSASVGEALPHIRDIRAISLNMLVADRANIAWQVTGRYPLRKNGRGLLPSPGWDGEYDWNGYLDPDRHPSAINPVEGFLATANHRIVAPDSDITLSSSWHYPFRSERIDSLLTQDNRHSAENSAGMQRDIHSGYALKLKTMLADPAFSRDLRAAIDRWKSESRRQAASMALQLIDEFDGAMRVDSGQACLVGAFINSAARRIFLDELGPDDSLAWRSFLDNNDLCYGAIMDHPVFRGNESPLWDDVATSQPETKADTIAIALADAWLQVAAELGNDPAQWQWGDLHTYGWKTEGTVLARHLGLVERTAMRLMEPYFNRGPYPAPGSYSTLDVAGFHLGRDFDVWLIPEMRMIVDFASAEPLIINNSTGQSENPSSPHYNDGIDAWLAHEYQAMPFGDENIRRQYTRTITLVPR